MDQEEVHVVESERPESAVKRAPGVVRLMEAVVQLARHVDVPAVDPRRPDRLADALLVAVHLCRVDVAVADLERHAHRLRRLIRVDLEDAEAELGNGAAVVEFDVGDTHTSSPTHSEASNP